MREMNDSVTAVDSATSFEVNSPPEKIQPSPLRVPPSPKFTNSPKLSRLGSVHLNLSQVARATRNFSPSLQIGEGGFGTVYRAQLDDGQVVAIKRAKKVSDTLYNGKCNTFAAITSCEQSRKIEIKREYLS